MACLVNYPVLNALHLYLWYCIQKSYFGEADLVTLVLKRPFKLLIVECSYLSEVL